MSLAERWYALHAAAPDDPAAESSLAAALASCRTAHPQVALTDDAFLEYLAAHLRLDIPITEALATIAIADLYLACAIVRGDPAAVRTFEQRLQIIDAAIAHLDGGTALVDDVKTAVRERVLAHGGRAKILEYQGRGSLAGWLKVVAVREALQLQRARRREAPANERELANELVTGPPLLDAQHRRIYRDAFTAALATLTPRERNLLRQHYLHRATVADIGTLYGVHGATAARWIAQIRETLLRRTRRGVGDALRLTGTELDSAMAKAADHVDYSLRHTLSYEH